MFNAGDMLTINNNGCQLWINGTRVTPSSGRNPLIGDVCEIKLTNTAYRLSEVKCYNAGYTRTEYFTISGDGLTATLNATTAGANYNTFTITRIVAPVVGLFDQSMIDVIKSVGATLKVGTSTISAPYAVPLNSNNVITAPEGKIFSVAKITSGSNVVNISLNATKNIASFSNSSAGNTYSNLVLETVTGNVTGCFSTDMIKTINDNNCDLVYNGEKVTTEKYALIGESYSIVCRPDWIFNIEPDAVGGFGVYGRYVKAGGSYVVDQWAISEDKKTATKTLDVSRNYSTFSVKTDQDVPINVLGGINNVYKVNADIMKALTKERFFVSSSGTGGDYLTFDYGQYIINLVQVPFSIPVENVIGSEPIQLALLETKTVAPMINTDLVNYNLGSINIIGDKGNLLDFNNKQAILHLPFSDPIVLDNQYVIDETITINLEINMYTGTGTYNISTTKIDEVIFTKTVSLGVNIPLANFYSMESKQILTSSLEWAGDNKLRVAYIELVDKNSDLNSGFFNTPIMDDTTLNTLQGYFSVVNANIKLQASSSEKSQIMSMLQSGVIIK